MLTWGAFLTLVGKANIDRSCRGAGATGAAIQEEIDSLRVETDENGWKPKAFSTALRSLPPNRVESSTPVNTPRQQSQSAVAELVPDTENKRFSIRVRSGVSELDLLKAPKGTILTDGRGQEPYLAYSLNGIEYRTKIATLRGDFTKPGGGTGNRLRLWEKSDFKPRPDDIYRRGSMHSMDAAEEEGERFDTSSALSRRRT